MKSALVEEPCQNCGSLSRFGNLGTPDSSYQSEWFCSECWQAWEAAEQSHSNAVEKPQRCEACGLLSRHGKVGDAESEYSDKWFCSICWSGWRRNDRKSECSREGCPFAVHSSGLVPFCCAECGKQDSRSKCHSKDCERIPWDRQGRLALATRREALVAKRAKGVLGEPLEYEVVGAGAAGSPLVSVREAPDESAAVLTRLSLGQRVSGFPSSNWLQLCGNSRKQLNRGWVMICGQLDACCLRVRVPDRGADGLLVQWAGLPLQAAASTVYSVEWYSALAASVGAEAEGARDSGRPTSGSTSRLNSCQVQLTDLPGDLRLRVSACLLNSSSHIDLKIHGPWATSLAVLPETCVEVALPLATSAEAQEEANAAEETAYAEGRTEEKTAHAEGRTEEETAFAEGRTEEEAAGAKEAVADAEAAVLVTPQKQAPVRPALEKQATPPVLEKWVKRHIPAKPETSISKEPREEPELMSLQDKVRMFETRRLLNDSAPVWTCTECLFDSPSKTNICSFCGTPRGKGMIAQTWA